MRFYRAEKIDELHVPVGETIALESLRETVIPPYLMLMPFVEVPEGVVVEHQYPLGEDGVHGSVYHLRAERPCEDDIVIGFRDLQTGDVTHWKVIHLTASETGGPQLAGPP